MNFAEILQSVRDVLNTQLFDVGATPVTIGTLLTMVLVILATIWISRVLQRGVRKTLARRGIKNEGTVGAISGLVNYAVFIAGIGVALQTAGIDLGTLFAAGALFAVGLGFAMQNIAQNFVSGVILLTERAIRPGDVLEVEGTVVRVLRMGIRATIVKTRDGEDLIVPNSGIVQASVKNFTLEDSVFRVRASVGVVYGSDMAQVRTVLEDVARDLKWRLREPEPQVLMLEFGDSSVSFEIAVWSDDPWKARAAVSDLNEAIWSAFKEHGITIAYPQLDVHFDPPVGKGLARLGATAA
jgi:potassium efflux system protein